MKKRILCAAIACTMMLTLEGCASNVTNDSSSTSAKQTEKKSENEMMKADYHLDETVVEETDNLKLTVESAKSDGKGWLLIDFAMENKNDVTGIFTISNLCINNCISTHELSLNPDKENQNSIKSDEMSNNYYVIPSGETAYFRSLISQSTLADRGIHSADEVSFSIIFQSSDYSTFFHDFEKRYNIFPTNKSSKEIVTPERNTTENEAVIIDEEDFKYVLYGISIHDKDFRAHIYEENNTNSNISIFWENITVNGNPYNFESYGADKGTVSQGYLIAHTIGYPPAPLYYEYFDNLSPSDSIEEISFTIVITEQKDISKELYRKKITWNPIVTE